MSVITRANKLPDQGAHTLWVYYICQYIRLTITFEHLEPYYIRIKKS